MRNIICSLYLYLASFILVGLYTILLYLIGHNFFPGNTKGQLIIDSNNQIRGSYLLVENLETDKYFRGRAQNIEGNKCSIALYSDKMRQPLIKKYQSSDHPYDITMLTSSSSLLDPYITRYAAIRQAPEIARQRKVDVNIILKMIDENTSYSIFPFFSLDIVNINILNALLDGIVP